LHAPESKAPATLAALQAFCAAHAALRLTLVRGNHDDRAGDPPAQMGIQVVDEPLACGPFALCHTPQEVPGAYVLAGHIHPSVRISTATEGARLPCFWFGQRYGVLPAFGGFTGTYCVKPQAQDRIYAIAGEKVLQVPAHVLARAA
jgi:metallophosphoesterase superfamily enzyme